MSDDSSKMNSPTEMKPQAPRTIQSVEQELTNSIFALGRVRYDRLLNEARESSIAEQCGKLAREANELRAKATAEMQKTLDGVDAPKLSILPGGAGDASKASPKPA